MTLDPTSDSGLPERRAERLSKVFHELDADVRAGRGLPAGSGGPAAEDPEAEPLAIEVEPYSLAGDEAEAIELEAALRAAGEAGDEEPSGPAPDDAPVSKDGEPVLPSGGTLCGALEALLLVANEPLELKDFTRLLGGCSWVPVRRELRALQQRYAAEGSGLELIEVAKGWRLLTKPVYADLVERLSTIQREERLSRAQLEVLAIVAYRQPVRRIDIDTLRGADSSGALRQLLLKDLVRVSGRADQLGRPLLYGTTRRFLSQFGLKSLQQLPKPDAQ